MALDQSAMARMEEFTGGTAQPPSPPAVGEMARMEEFAAGGKLSGTLALEKERIHVDPAAMARMGEFAAGGKQSGTLALGKEKSHSDTFGC